MKRIVWTAIAVLVLGIGSASAAATSEAFVRQVNQGRSSAFVAQVAGPSVRISVVFRSIYRTARDDRPRYRFPIPDYAAPGLSGDTALGFFLNSNRGLQDEHERIFRDFLR